MLWPVVAHYTTSDCVAEKFLLQVIQEVKERQEGTRIPKSSLRVHPQ